MLVAEKPESSTKNRQMNGDGTGKDYKFDLIRPKQILLVSAAEVVLYPDDVVFAKVVACLQLDDLKGVDR